MCISLLLLLYFSWSCNFSKIYCFIFFFGSRISGDELQKYIFLVAFMVDINLYICEWEELSIETAHVILITKTIVARVAQCDVS